MNPGHVPCHISPLLASMTEAPSAYIHPEEGHCFLLLADMYTIGSHNQDVASNILPFSNSLYPWVML